MQNIRNNNYDWPMSSLDTQNKMIWNAGVCEKVSSGFGWN